MRLPHTSFSGHRSWFDRRGDGDSILDTITMWIVILLAVATLVLVSGAFLSML